jgi:adenosine deaminase
MCMKNEPNHPITERFVRALPKTDLHVHLDGSLRLGTLIELAKDYGIELPSYTETGLHEIVYKDRYENLGQYLRGFGYTVAVLQSELALERVAYEFAQDNQNEGVYYVEVRFAPQLHAHQHLSAIMVLKAVNRGLHRAKQEFNQGPDVVDGKCPSFEYGIICCALRMFRAGFSEYYTNLIRAHRYAPPKEVYAMASKELARAAILARDEHGLPVVGFDLAGEESGYPANDHYAAFQMCQENFMKKTVHAGEAYGPESIFQAVTKLGADRIGHGTSLLDPDAIQDPSITNREAYIQSLEQYIADRRITLEVCLSSNLQTNPQMKSLSDHSFQKLRTARLSTTICTDNRLVSHTNVTKELMLAATECGLSLKDLKSIVVYGFKRSFFPGGYLNKRRYVRSVIDYYESVEKRFHQEHVAD